MEPDIRIFENPLALAKDFAREIYQLALDHQQENKMMNIALSGGNTPTVLFNILASEYSSSMPWASIHFFWVDERCVSPVQADSNYRMSLESLLSKIVIPADNIHRIRGEAKPELEVQRYASEINSIVPKENLLPRFDLIILGLGEDGHTASIFPNQMGILQSDNICEMASHPQSGQQRISLTGKVINSATWIVFIATGNNKSRIVHSVLKEKKRFFPASHIHPIQGKLSWFLDRSAASRL